MNDNYLYPFNNQRNELYGPYEGYIKGNLFKNLYEEYKNYKPISINFSNEKDEELFNLNQICFAMHELNLYLDIHPNDEFALYKYTEYQDIANNLQKQYEAKYGPINVDSINNNIPFSWISTNFPWEVI